MRDFAFWSHNSNLQERRAYGTLVGQLNILNLLEAWSQFFKGSVSSAVQLPRTVMEAPRSEECAARCPRARAQAFACVPRSTELCLPPEDVHRTTTKIPSSILRMAIASLVLMFGHIARSSVSRATAASSFPEVPSRKASSQIPCRGLLDPPEDPHEI